MSQSRDDLWDLIERQGLHLSPMFERRRVGEPLRFSIYVPPIAERELDGLGEN